MTRVLLVDDQDLVRQGLRLILDLAGIDVVGEARDGAQAVVAVADLDPDVVLMDLRMPGMDGVEATRLITGSGARARVLALTTFDVDEHVVGVLRAGAVGYLLKDVTADDLVAAVRRAAAGEPVVAPAVLARMMANFADRPPANAAVLPGLGDLSEREREVLALIGAGRSNAEIADTLVISMATVKTHVRHIFAKLDLRDRAQAVVAARDAGLS
ncbi:response regulator [Nocardioides sp. MAH-18]|uniref:Response regulator n=1 Tax=Nocardioides agri TaxID=2682843 RepID=A0A6L6XTG4_9ACTN|nr:response regulator transcription factor [Nocardioides sp. CGMCC 1.13656]MBA2955845.1 response regulator transcription factor [Nocardioides sp. CGMCC 1.13656]MVQ50694.1 response regulator [Nocardioides sp. MAH-18]